MDSKLPTGWIVGIALVVMLAAPAYLPRANAPVLRPAAARPTVSAPPSPDAYLPLVRQPQPRILIAAAHIDSALSGEPDEAIQLWNLDAVARPLAGWRLRANNRTASFPLTSTVTIPARGHIWCTKAATSFRQSFGFSPHCEWSESDPAIPNLDGSLPLANNGGVLHLLSPQGAVIDTLLYGNRTATAPGWQDGAAQIYARGQIPVQGQVWRRKLDPVGRLPLDSDGATDWAGDLADLAWGRQVFFPGWSIWQESQAAGDPVITSEATTTVAVGPEGLYPFVAEQIAAAAATIDLSLYAFEHAELAAAVADAARRGVRVRLLLEGSPAGGVSDLQRWSLLHMADAGVQIFYMDTRADAPAGYRPRYRFVHAKYAIFDSARVLVSTENFSYEAMPLPVAGGLPVGRRGAALLTDAGAIVMELSQLFNGDWAPQQFTDLRPIDAGVDGPPAGYVPSTPAAMLRPGVSFAGSVHAQDAMQMALITAPEKAMHPDSALMALLARAGAGDAIHWTQLYEHKFWGDGRSNPVADPNPRLELLIEAARRGATVRVLLDSFFDDPEDLRSNRATVEYLNLIAQTEGLDMEARTGNPTGGGIHMKLVLAKVDGEVWTALGSLNGGEVSHKLNREVILMTDAPAIYDQLREVFLHDWALAIR